MWTNESIKELLSRNNAAVERALLVLYERQTTAEQVSGSAHEHNRRGFSAVDAEILSSFACQVQKKQGRGLKLGECLSEKQMAIAKKKVQRYAKQLAEVANEKSAPKVEAAEGAAEPASPLADFRFFLRRPRQPWIELTEEQARRWHAQLVQMAAFYRSGVEIVPFDSVTESRFWINYAGELLQLVKNGEEFDRGTDKWAEVAEKAMLAQAEREAKKVAAEVLEKEMWEIEAAADRAGTLRDETNKAEARRKMEGHSLKTYAADPEAREYGSIKSKITAWASK